MTSDDNLTHGDLANVLRQMRKHVATRDDLRELADVLDNERVRCPPHAWRFVVVRDPATGLIAELLATPIEVPQ